MKITIGRWAAVLTGNAGVCQVLGRRTDDLENYPGGRSADQAGVAPGAAETACRAGAHADRARGHWSTRTVTPCARA